MHHPIPESTIPLLSACKILLVGAGGLGCDLLPLLYLSGFRHIHVIDMDTVDLSNLNRQFLFRSADIGKSKAESAAKLMNKKFKTDTIVPHFCTIQSLPTSFYSQFQLIICGLDSVPARRWINELVISLSPDVVIPLIDGGTESFKGQARVIVPGHSSCYECSLALNTPKVAYPLCTIANTPRLPEHCVEWAAVVKWPEINKDKKIDNDDPNDIAWLFKHASERAQSFSISGVTWSLTQGVIKNIIPAIASTNAIIAAACVSEAVKIATNVRPVLNNYMMYNGSNSVYTYTFEHERMDNCPVCGDNCVKMNVDGNETLQAFIHSLAEHPQLQLKKPSLVAGKTRLYFQGPPQLEERTRPNLQKSLRDLIENGDTITVTDPSVSFSVDLEVFFKQ